MATDAFISYSHEADRDLAPAIEKGMERLAKPWFKLRALEVFRDQSDLALTPHLWETIRRNLDGSGHLVVLLSPASASSRWVNEEVAHWCDERGTEQLLLVLTGGELVWDDAAADFSAASTAVPPALRGRYSAEPLYEDLRWGHGASDLTLRNPAFRSSIARLAAPIHGVAPGDLESEDVRLRRRARRFAQAGVAALAVLTVAATVASVAAVRQSRRANERAAEAEARRDALAALDLPISRLDEALVESLAAAESDADNPDRFRSAQTLVGRYPRLAELLPVGVDVEPAVDSGLAVGTSGQVAVDVLTIADGGAARALTRPQSPATPPVDLGDSFFVAFVGDSSSVVSVGQDGTGRVIDQAGRERVLDGEVLALIAGSDRAVVGRGGRQVLVEPGSGDDVADLGAVSGVRPLFTSEVVVAVVDDAVVLDDPVTGERLASGPLMAAPLAVFTNTSGSVVATIEGAAEAPVLRRWVRDGGSLEPSGETVDVPVEGGFTSGALSPSGERFFAYGIAEHAVVDTATGAVVTRPRGELVRVDSSGHFVATGGNRLTVWDIETGETLFAAPEPVKTLAWSANCDKAGSTCRLATVGAGLDVWEPVTRVRTVLADEINAEAVALSSDGSTVASGGWGRTIAVWSARMIPDERLPVVVTRSAPGGRAVLEPESGVVARLSDGRVEIDPGGGDVVVARVAEPSDVGVVPGGGAVLVADGTGAWTVVDPATGAERAVDERCRADLWAADPAGRFLAGLDPESGVLAVCTVADGALVAVAEISGIDGPSAIAVEQSGAVLVGGSEAFAVYTLVGDQLATGSGVLTSFGGEASPVSSAAFSNGRVAVGLLGGDGSATGAPVRGRVVVWDILAGTEPVAYDVDERDVVKVALLDGGRTLATVARDTADGALTVQVWETGNRRRLGRSLTGLQGEAHTLVGDASSVVASDATGRVLRWELSADPRGDICDILGAPFDDDRRAELGLDAADDPCR